MPKRSAAKAVSPKGPPKKTSKVSAKGRSSSSKPARDSSTPRANKKPESTVNSKNPSTSQAKASTKTGTNSSGKTPPVGRATQVSSNAKAVKPKDSVGKLSKSAGKSTAGGKSPEAVASVRATKAAVSKEQPSRRSSGSVSTVKAKPDRKQSKGQEIDDKRKSKAVEPSSKTKAKNASEKDKNPRKSAGGAAGSSARVVSSKRPSVTPTGKAQETKLRGSSNRRSSIRAPSVTLSSSTTTSTSASTSATTSSSRTSTTSRSTSCTSVTTATDSSQNSGSTQRRKRGKASPNGSPVGKKKCDTQPSVGGSSVPPDAQSSVDESSVPSAPSTSRTRRVRQSASEVKVRVNEGERTTGSDTVSEGASRVAENGASLDSKTAGGGSRSRGVRKARPGRPSAANEMSSVSPSSSSSVSNSVKGKGKRKRNLSNNEEDTAKVAKLVEVNGPTSTVVDTSDQAPESNGASFQEAEQASSCQEATGNQGNSCRGPTYLDDSCEINPLTQLSCRYETVPERSANPLFNREVITVPATGDVESDSGLQFSVVTYNILAEFHRSQYDYSYSSDDVLDLQYRDKRLREELDWLDADVLCLQEVEPDYYRDLLKPAMESRGYAGIYHQRRKGVGEGEVTFWKASVFSLANSLCISTREIAEQYISCTEHSDSVKDCIRSYLDRDSVMIAVHLTSTHTQQSLCVGNIHVTWAGFQTTDIQCIQTSCAINKMLEFSSGTTPFVLCGDFNSKPTDPAYQLAADGYLGNGSLAKLQSFSTVTLPSGEKKALVNLVWPAFQHSAYSLESTYAVAQGGVEPVVTSLNRIMCECVDYLWTRGLSVRGVLQTAAVDRPIPDAVFPSDHLSLKAQFSLPTTSSLDDGTS